VQREVFLEQGKGGFQGSQVKQWEKTWAGGIQKLDRKDLRGENKGTGNLSEVVTETNGYGHRSWGTGRNQLGSAIFVSYRSVERGSRSKWRSDQKGGFIGNEKS